MGRDVEGSGLGPVRGAVRGLVWTVRGARVLDEGCSDCGQRVEHGTYRLRSNSAANVMTTFVRVCQEWSSLTFRERHRVGVFGNRVVGLILACGTVGRREMRV
jgi:hypothetical protein